MNRSTRNLLIFFAAAVLAAFAFIPTANAASFSVTHADLFGSLGSALASVSGMSAIGLSALGSIAPVTENHAATKFFRIALEGATTDGRVIERAWIEQAAKNYDPKTFTARINLEHIRGIVPDGPFKAYGDVIALEAREESDGKLGLYAQLAPTADLVSMTKAKQKCFTSCEFDPSFADTGEAYLVGLAVTDSPASLGNEVLTFAAKATVSPFAARKLSPQNLFTEATEANIEFETAKPGISLFNRVKELLTRKSATDDARFADVNLAVETIATHAQEQADSFSKQTQTVEQMLTQLGDLKTQFAELTAKLNLTSTTKERPAATGGDGNLVTDC